MNIGYIITIALIGFIVSLEIAKKVITKIRNKKEQKKEVTEN